MAQQKLPEVGDVRWVRDGFGIPTRFTVNLIREPMLWGCTGRNSLLVSKIFDTYGSLRECEESVRLSLIHI